MDAKQIVKDALGIDWENTEMQARRVAEYVVTELVQQPAAVVGHHQCIKCMVGTGPHATFCKLYTVPVPAAGVQGDSALRRKLEDYFAGHDISTEEMMAWVKIYATVQPDSGRDAALDVNSLRNQMAYIAAYSMEDIDDMRHERLRGWAHAVLDRAKRALAAHPAPSSDAGQVKTPITKEWCERMASAEIESGANIEAGADVPWQWTPGPDEFKAWCSSYFGPDSDETYLAEAVFNLPTVAQKFKWHAAHPANGAQAGDNGYMGGSW